MKDLKHTIIKLIISAIILSIAFYYLGEKPRVNIIHFDTSGNKETNPTPSKLQWYDSFKGIENVPSKEKDNN